MIQIDGTDYAQPTDLDIVSYGGADYVLISVGNVVKRVAVSALAQAVHDHSGQNIFPNYMYSRYHRGPAGSTYTEIAGVNGSPYIRCINGGGASDGTLTYLATVQHTFSVPGTNKFVLQGVVGQRSAIADAWNLYACSEELKTDIVEIPAAVSKVESIKGISYVQDGFASVGVSAEDLESLGLPNLVVKDKDGKYESVNPVGLIPVLVQAVKELSARVAVLEGVK